MLSGQRAGKKGASHMGVWGENFPGNARTGLKPEEGACCVVEGARWLLSKEQEPQEARGPGQNVVNLVAQDGGLDWRVLRGKVAILLPPLTPLFSQSPLIPE